MPVISINIKRENVMKKVSFSLVESLVLVTGIMVSGIAHAATCSTDLLLGTRWSNIKCEDRTGDSVPETVAWYNHRSGSISEVVFSQNGSIISNNRLGRQSRQPVSPELAAVCKTTTALARSDIWKAKQSNHIPSGDVRQNSTAFIILRAGRTFKPNCMLGYSNTGKLVHKLGAYFPTGTPYNKRLYGGWGCGDHKTPVQVAAASKGGLYLKVSSNSCVVVPQANRCYNSSGC